MIAKSLTSAVLSALLSGASGNSMYMAKLCSGHICDTPDHPILDYAEDEKKCICRAHPCWETDGMIHSCDANGKFPYLSFSYDEDRNLSCGCSATPFYAAVHINKNLCAGHFCEAPEHPVLDWDEEKGTCICRAHPCSDIEGVTHECSDPKFPILRYREDEPETKTGKPKAVCECAQMMHAPSVRNEL